MTCPNGCLIVAVLCPCSTSYVLLVVDLLISFVMSSLSESIVFLVCVNCVRMKCSLSLLNNMTTFKAGDSVRALVSTQGLKKGNCYKITAVDEEYYPFGSFMQYQVDKGNWIINGHLLLEKLEVPAV